MTRILAPSNSLAGKKAQVLPILMMVYKYIADHGRSPSMRVIAQAFPNPETTRPASTNTVSLWIDKLVEVGWLEKEKSGHSLLLNRTPDGLKEYRREMKVWVENHEQT